MANYPDPCVKCRNNKNNNCTKFRHCQRWLARYRHRQKQINCYANKHQLEMEIAKQTIGKKPCDTCTRVKDPLNCSNRRCADWKKWYLARQKLINGYAKKHLPDYAERKKEGVHYDYEED